MRKLHAVLLIAVLFSVAAISTAHGQGGTSQYIYDANGRLGAVIAPSGSAAVYHYDAAGNLTSIEQMGAGGFSLLSFSPQLGTIGDQVTLTGVGLDTATSVSFNGTPSSIISAAPNSLVTKVPQGGSTGLITVSGARGSASSSTTFSVVARVDVSPGTVEILPGEVVLFQASVVGTPNQQVTWAVNGISGGNSSVGTISTSGFYQSPTINNALEVTVSAISQADTAVSGQADVRILNPNTTSEIRSPRLTVSLGPSSSFVAQTPLVAVLKGNILGIEAAPLAVALGEPLAISSRAVSTTTGPVITTISPATLTRGTSPTVTLTGQNLGGATAVSFSTGNGVEGNITASNISVSPNGTTLTFTATVGASAAAGTDVVIVTTANGKSQVLSTGGNTVRIQ